jgi:hypothetical protein
MGLSDTVMGQSDPANERSAPVQEDKVLNRLIVGTVSLVMILVGAIIVVKFHSIDTLRPYVRSIVALTFMAPLVLLLGYFKVISPDGTAAVVGAMAAYFFGTERANS